MDNPHLSQLSIQLASAGATDEEMDRMTRQLLLRLRDTNVESAELERGGPVPEGAKGDPATIGSIAVQLLPGVLPSIIGLVQSWVAAGSGRTVKFKSRDFEFEGSPEELQKLLQTLGKGKKR